jgi:hypothetical protein
MPRKVRVQYPGAIYHVMSRGDRREDIFLDEERMELRRAAQEDEEALAPIRRGWCLGSVEFKRQMLQRMDGQLGDHHAGDLRRENAEGRAERIIAEELQRLGCTESELLGQRKSAAGKLALAARLRRETTMPLKWIAARVRLGTSKSANSKLHLWMKENKKPGADAVMASVENRENQA